MPKLTEAIEIKVTVETKSITISDALMSVTPDRDTEYRCPKCGKPVIPFKEESNTGAAAHFEHHPGQSCSGKK